MPKGSGAGGNAAGVLGGMLDVFGGEYFDNGGRVHPEAWCYDPKTDAWTSAPPMPTPRHGLGAVAIGEAMQAGDIPVCPVLTPDEALASAHARARGMTYVEHDPHDGEVMRIGNPLTRSGLATHGHQPPPLLGEHTGEVLAELGLAPGTTPAAETAA